MTTETLFDDNIDYSCLEAKYVVQRDDNFDSILIIDHLPRVDAAKEEKLINVLRKNIFSGHGNVVEGGIFMPRNSSDGLTKGYMFVEFETVEQADAVHKVAHSYRLDKQHVLYAFKFTDFERLAHMDENFVEPQVDAFEEREYLRSWLIDPLARDQIMTLAAKHVNVFWANRVGQPEMIQSRANWTESSAQWSSYGTYLVTLHAPGVALWGGSSWKMITRFPHPNVKLVDFSPGENYLVTWSILDPKSPNEPNLLVWDVPNQKLVRGFVTEQLPPATAPEWPMLKWSFNDKYMTRVHEGCLGIYETPSFALLDKKPMKIDGIQEAIWSPVDLNLVYWTPGNDDTPARVAIMKVPSREILRTKNLFNVNLCKIYWHSSGDYLSVQVDRHAKNKKQVMSNLELFRIREKNIPVEVVEFKEILSDFAWEPQGDRFLISQTSEGKSVVTFYTMKATDSDQQGFQIKPLNVVERKALTHYLWSPKGDFIVLATVGGTSATMEFWNVNEMTMMAAREHFMATDIGWDPSGRYVTSYVSWWKHQMDNGFIMWDFKGDQISKVNQSKFMLMAWRPRPPSLLTREIQRNIRKNLKKYSVVFEEHDAVEMNQSSTNVAETRRRLRSEWNEWRKQSIKSHHSRDELRELIMPTKVVDQNEATTIEEWMEEVVGETEEVIAAASRPSTSTRQTEEEEEEEEEEEDDNDEGSSICNEI